MSATKQKRLETKILSNSIGDWVGKNKKVFWKYEVSCFYETYKIRVVNLPDPSIADITVSSHSRLLNDQQKTQLCNTVKKACARPEAASNSYIDVKVAYVDGAVVTEVIQAG